MKATYKIPCAHVRESSDDERIGPELLASSTMVFIVPPEAAGHSDLSNVRFQEDPLKKGVFPVQFEVQPWGYRGKNQSSSFWTTWFEGRFVPLSRARVWDRVVIPVNPRRGRPCIQFHNKVSHAATSMVSALNSDEDPKFNVRFVCGDYEFDKRLGDHFVVHTEGVSTCPECSTHWQLFYVAPHTVPKAEKRNAEKVRKGARKAERKFLARPTRFDRVIDELPPPKVPAVRVVEDDPFEPEGRGSKLDARARQGQLEKQKREDFKRERRWK